MYLGLGFWVGFELDQSILSLTFPSKVDLAAPSVGYLLLRGHRELPITRMHKNE
jgi:hypothetical protein